MTIRIGEYSSNFLKYKGLLKELVVRDLKTKYRRSVLGFLWSLLNPLLMMVVVTVVFSFLFRFQIANYPIYLLTGQVIFTFFSEATNTSMNSIINSAPLIKKIYIPKYIFPLSRSLSAFVNLLFSLVAIIIMMIITKVKVSFVLLLFPLPLIYILIFAVGVGLILSVLAVFFRDMLHLYSVLLTAWMYFTPIFYPISIIPAKYMFVMKLNPLYYYITCFRNIVLDGVVPSLNINLACIGIATATLLLGMLIFYRNQDKFILFV